MLKSKQNATTIKSITFVKDIAKTYNLALFQNSLNSSTVEIVKEDLSTEGQLLKYFRKSTYFVKRVGSEIPHLNRCHLGIHH